MTEYVGAWGDSAWLDYLTEHFDKDEESYYYYLDPVDCQPAGPGLKRKEKDGD